ncbi:MAG: carboxylating nicotinate-nucleotide diphosphorylase [Armatimonadota bacterium]
MVLEPTASIGIPASVLDEVVRRALAEDIGTGDITTEAVVPAEAYAVARAVCKSNGILAGIPVAEAVFRAVDPEVLFQSFAKDGEWGTVGFTIFEVRGAARSLLIAERTALNFLQHLSGIATRTARCVGLVHGTKARIVDTRKTTPGLRVLEKYAVRVGGGCNHRFNLSDGILIKDNHIAAAGSISEAVRRAKMNSSHLLKIEVEASTLEQVQEALDAGADAILLDNMPPELLRQAVQLVDGRAVTEASGGITEENLREVAETGVDIISLGALTHSVEAMDISMSLTLVA